MQRSEYVRNMNSNYERILLEEKPDEKRYQYCMISKGGIKGLLSCSLRYIDDLAYLYYDITSMQNVEQLCSKKIITRNWMKNFLWSMQQVNIGLARFLLDDRNIIWHPEHMFQDLEREEFSFLYIPYFDGECGFLKLIEFLIDHIDYDDEVLVEYIYKMHEQYEFLGTIYLQEQIFIDAKVLDQPQTITSILNNNIVESLLGEMESIEVDNVNTENENTFNELEERKTEKRGLLHLLDGRRKKYKLEKARIQQNTDKYEEEFALVCEEPAYEADEYGKTVYIEETEREEPIVRRLYTSEGKCIVSLTKPSFLIGKKKEEVDIVLQDASVSRIHAKITQENGKFFIEDINSTNGTFKNGLRLQPYEKRVLESEDEIKFGKTIFIYR